MLPEQNVTTQSEIKEGDVLEGVVTTITNFGAFVDFPGGKSGLVHISQISLDYVKEVKDRLKIGQTVKVKVLKIEDNGKIALSIKEADRDRKRTEESFESMMSNFKKLSETKVSDYKKSLDRNRGRNRV